MINSSMKPSQLEATSDKPLGIALGACSEKPQVGRRTRASAQIGWPLLLLALSVCLGAELALSSPPVDYFIYTSRLASSYNSNHSNANYITSFLPSIASIYVPPKSVLDSIASNSTESDKLPLNESEHEQRQQQGQRAADEQLKRLAGRVLNLIQNSSHTHDNDKVDLMATQYAWSLMERQAELYMQNRILAVKPFIMELLDESDLSLDCTRSIMQWIDNVTQLKQWATLMWNSWGQFPPVGVFQGSYTDLGSYSGCMSIEENRIIGEPQYCMLDFQPIIPSRPRFHSIFKRILDHDGQKLDHGDFKIDHPTEEISSRHTSHGFASHRFKELFKKFPTPANAAGSKFLKRTIDPDYGRHTANQSDLLQPELNITLKAEALIELARKAQYFYYVTFRIGACLPSKCSKKDVTELAKSASQRAILQSISVNCMRREPFHLNTYQLVAIIVLSGLALIAVLGAIVDLLGYKENPNDASALVNWLLPFSICTNAKRLFATDTAGTHGDLECVHGLRFFSMVWVIYGHTILYLEYQSFTHFYDVVETQIPSLLLLPSLNANFSVDTFFVISGILTTYVTWEYTKGDARKFNKFAFMISRYIRLTPQLAIVILCFFIMPLFGDGALYRSVANEQAELCYKNWPINLLYLQSYVNSDKLCIDPSWWLSIEMTFHVVSVLVIIVMINNPRRGLWLNFAVAAAFTLVGVLIHYMNGFAIQYLPSIPQRFEIHDEQTMLFFHRPYPHAASYFIGIALGYVLANKSIKKLSYSQRVQGWTLCAFGLLVSLYGTYYWNLGAPYTQLQATLYYNLCQILWPISIAWIILACSLGHGGIVDSILSARCFVPLGRITYMTYLSHSLIIYYHSARMSMTVEPSMMFFTYLFIANTVVALLLGVILTVVYESPILNLQKQLFTYLTQKFDPTVRDGQRHCLPTRLEQNPQQIMLAGSGGENTIVIGELDSRANGSAMMKNGYAQASITNGYGLLAAAAAAAETDEDAETAAKNGLTSPTAQCLLLNQNNEKQLNQK